MKKSTLAILTTVIALAPLTALAQDSQTSVQGNTNSAAGVGQGNVILQNADQTNVQHQVDLDKYGHPQYEGADAQTSVQGNVNEAAAIGEHNTVIQDAEQTSVQDQVDVDGYLAPKY